jgi:glycerol-3-phosphate dehydrogenase
MTYTRQSPYDVIIIGAGIVGAGIFRELASNNTSCLIVDKGDFSSQTSARSSKMLHGGIRYLEQYDFELVWEALHEKNYWLKTAPHLCKDEEFFLPVYKDSLHPFWKIRMGLMAYDVLSGLKNTPHRQSKLEEYRATFPGVRSKGFVGCGVYHDGIMDDAKMGLECIYDGGLYSRTQALSYHELVHIKKVKTRWNVVLQDRLTGEEKQFLAKQVVFALGPFTDQVLSKHLGDDWTPRLLTSKGSHLWISKEALPIKRAMVITDNGGRVIFVIPHGHAVLVGTTEVPADENYFDIVPSKKEITYLLDNLRHYFPDRPLDESCIISSYAGIRPLVSEGDSTDRGKTARNHKIFYPSPGLHVIMGGKYTTFRIMARDLVRPLMRELGKNYCPEKTSRPFRRPSQITPFGVANTIDLKLVENVIQSEYVRTIDDLIVRRLGISSAKHWPANQSPFASYQEFKQAIVPLAQRYGLKDLNAR